MHIERLLVTLQDGTIKQRNPFSWTEVWTLPDRGKRPIESAAPPPVPIDPTIDHCVFCAGNYFSTPPEKARAQRNEHGRYELVTGALASELADPNHPLAEFRRVSNLFEILSYPYWHINYGYRLTPEAQAQKMAYLGEQRGLQHIRDVATFKMKTIGEELTDDKLDNISNQFFGGGHDLIIGREHYAADATCSNELVGSGQLTVEGHAAYTQMAVDSIHDHYASNPYALYVAVFQNWLKPAGASMDHLHKQVVSMDERGPNLHTAYGRCLRQPNLFNEAAVNIAVRKGLTIAENEHAIALAGFGHRYPTIELYSKSPTTRPWMQTPAEIRAMSDLLHACHRASGADIPCNEEWHHQGVDVEIPMPWRINIKWRISTLAGFEGGTKIFINTVSPWDVRDRVVGNLEDLRADGSIADMRIGDEVSKTLNPLLYNQHMRAL